MAACHATMDGLGKLQASLAPSSHFAVYKLCSEFLQTRDSRLYSPVDTRLVACLALITTQPIVTGATLHLARGWLLAMAPVASLKIASLQYSTLKAKALKVGPTVIAVLRVGNRQISLQTL